MTTRDNLTGLWHGLYSYRLPSGTPESHFTAVIIDSGGHLSGSVSEEMRLVPGGSVPARAMLEGRREGAGVAFRKSYDGSGGQHHHVDYRGAVLGEGEEIEGEWHLPHRFGGGSGRFLMIRNRPVAQEAEERVEARV